MIKSTQLKHIKLNELKNEEDILYAKYVNISFPTEEGIKKYIKENQNELSRLKEIWNEIKELEWELNTPKQKQEFLEYQNKLNEKYSEE